MMTKNKMVRIMGRTCRLTAFLVSTIFVSNSFSYTVEELLRTCKINPNGYCLGFITGFYEGFSSSNTLKIMFKICPPSDSSSLNLAVSPSQMVMVFMKWANDHPEKLYLEEWLGIGEAFSNAWPCPK